MRTGWQEATATPAELVREIFNEVEVERWDAPFDRVPDRDAGAILISSLIARWRAWREHRRLLREIREGTHRVERFGPLEALIEEIEAEGLTGDEAARALSERMKKIK